MHMILFLVENQAYVKALLFNCSVKYIGSKRLYAIGAYFYGYR